MTRSLHTLRKKRGLPDTETPCDQCEGTGTARNGGTCRTCHGSGSTEYGADLTEKYEREFTAANEQKMFQRRAKGVDKAP